MYSTCVAVGLLWLQGAGGIEGGTAGSTTGAGTK